MMGLAVYSLVGGFMRKAFRVKSALWVAVWAMMLSGGIEWSQMYIRTRYGNITDILLAGLGAWSGAMICSGIESRNRRPDQGVRHPALTPEG
jgi:glycopeptide antibiotics resistance protein